MCMQLCTDTRIRRVGQNYIYIFGRKTTKYTVKYV